MFWSKCSQKLEPMFVQPITMEIVPLSMSRGNRDLIIRSSCPLRKLLRKFSKQVYIIIYLQIKKIIFDFRQLYEEYKENEVMYTYPTLAIICYLIKKGNFDFNAANNEGKTAIKFLTDDSSMHMKIFSFLKDCVANYSCSVGKTESTQSRLTK